MKARLRRLKGRFHEGLEDFRSKSDQSETPAAGDQVPSRIESDFQQSDTRISQQGDRAEGAAELGEASSSVPQYAANGNATDPSTIEDIDISSWINVWPEAYENVKTDPEHSALLQRLETFLQSEEENLEAADDVKPSNEPPEQTHDTSRLKAIQRNAEERLKSFSDAHLSFEIRARPIVVRDSVLKAVQVINALKPMITGAVAAEPSAALAWAGVTTILPILENIFQQDENAATGLTNIIFLMARYQGFHDMDFVSQIKSPSTSGASQELLSRVRDELISIYSKVYVYEARFILQYGKRNKAHRALRNALSADDWKKSWSDIEAISNRIDKGVTAQVNAATLKTWKAVEYVQEHVARLETMQNDFDRRQLLQSLQITGNASHDSYRSSRVEAPCLPGTQRHILQTIQEWTENPQGEMILWLEGMAGTGKTSIALTVASVLEAQKPFTDTLERASKASLGASFFFSQGDTTRNNTFELFRTIAWCLADMAPEFGLHVTKAIKDNPGIQTKVPLQQLQKLVVGPLTLLDESKFVPLNFIVVIDALDECEKEDAQDLLGMLVHLQNLHQIQLRFLITSRPEGHIAMSFESLCNRLWRRVQLKKIKSTTDENNDIVYYLSKTLSEIAQTQGVMGDGVSDVDIKRLAEKADGLFIYAATACRFLSPIFAHKTLRDEHLSLIFEDELEEEGPQQMIDGIYLKVLAFPDIQRSHQKVQTTFYTYISRVIGFIVVLFRPASLETLFHLLQTSPTAMTDKVEERAKGDLNRYLRRLHSIINVPEEPGLALSLVHLSFRDFILDQKRSERLPFNIDEVTMHREVLHRCFALMKSKLRENICRLNLPGSLVSDLDPSHISSYIPPHLHYACRYWADHLIQTHRKFFANAESEDIEYQTSVNLVYSFLKDNLLSWLEVMAFIGEASSIILVFSQLERFIELSTNRDLSSLLHDAKRFVLNNRWSIEHAPLQMYCSALLFCPKDSLVRYYYQKMIPVWITKKPETQQTWPAELSTLEGHTSHIHDTAFSPTKTLLASVSRDNTTRVWDYITGSEMYRFEDPGRPLKVCFSADGFSLASGCLDGTVRVRDLRKGTDVSFRSPSYVCGMLFSPTSCNILASILNNNVLSIWNIEEKRQVTALQLPDRDYQKHIAVSPDGEFVAICLDDYAALCNVELGQLVHEFLPHERLMASQVGEYICGLSISTDNKIVAVRFNESVDFWGMTPPNPKLIRTYKATWSVFSSFLFISPDEMIRICQTHSQTHPHMVNLFDLVTGDSIGTFLESFVKQDPHEGPLQEEVQPYQSLIRILSGPSTSTFRDRKLTIPNNVELLYGNNMALSYSFGKEAKQWNAIEGYVKAFEVNVKAVTYSPNREFVLLQLEGGDDFQVWDRSLTRKIAAYEELVYLDFVPQTNNLVSLSLSGNLQVLRYDPESLSFEMINTFSLPGVYSKTMPEMFSWRARSAHVSPNGEVIVIVLDCHDHDYKIQVWNIPRREMVKETRYHLITQVVFSPDSEYVCVEYGESLRRTQLLHTSNVTEVEGCNLYYGGFIRFNPSGRMFGIISEQRNAISVWEGKPWMTRFVFQVPERYNVSNFAFSAANKLAALSRSFSRGSIIDVWDTVAGEKLGSQSLVFQGYVFSLRFAQSERFLESSRGRLPLPRQDPSYTDLDELLDGLHTCLYVLDDWVYQGHERLIWLPPSYRPLTDRAQSIDVQGNTIALGCEGNCVRFIGISLEDTPVANHYLEMRNR